MGVELTTEIDASAVPELLQLEYEASAPFYEFIYDNVAEAREAQRILWDAGAGEWAPPHGLFAMRDHEFVGLLGGGMTADLERIHLAASLALGRAGILDDEDRSRRMQLAVQALAHPEAGDFYYSVVGVTPAARGSEVGGEVFDLARQHARERGARRVIGQTLADNERLVAFYERTGHHWIGEGKAADPKTGRSLHYRHFAIDL
jgi:ribosomal protein S18 acetylase RimI-like enzyme